MMKRSRSPLAVVALFCLLAALPASAQTAAAPRKSASAAKAPPRPSVNHVPPARFADPDRLAKLSRAFPEIDRAFLNFARGGAAPAVAWGVIIDGTLVHSGATGARDMPSNAKAMPDSVFRIASMTKNFAGLAIMKLRDQGRLALDAPVSRYVPELRTLPYPTTDSPAITVRHLLTHSEGFPEDNPWGDRQLAESDATLSRWMRAGFPFSQAPGMGYEYSNTGFAILGQVIARVSGMRARDFIDREFLKPLGMAHTKWDTQAVPGERIARGYARIDGE
jgi:CubicO group peptidase (beta-lactamase class C family)